ncbi:hypothetical protein BDZ97DRAFT_1760683 [Flammula alnicola]|nr:hypothetical protein BDZ97DRAFT_1760683 [Flammula alnicola]
MKVWDLKTRKEIRVPQQPSHERSQVSCVCWVTRRNETMDMLCYGNGLGFLVFLQHRPSEVGLISFILGTTTKQKFKGRFEVIFSARLARGGEIICIAADTSNGSTVRLATGTRDKCVQVWLFDSSSRKLSPVHSKAYGSEKEIVPKAVAFDDNDEQDLYIFGLYDGGL